ncbi:MAG: hypothetical protein ACYDC1_14405 [Limisphaerales bacterium]
MKPIIGLGGKLRGYIRHIGNRNELLAPGGRLLGYYDEEQDQTILPGGRLYGYGDQLMNFLEG